MKDFIKITEELIFSDAYQSLTLSANKILMHALLKTENEKGYISIPYSELRRQPFNMRNSTITIGFKALIMRGFIDIIVYGGGKGGHKSIYAISDKWKEWTYSGEDFSVGKNPNARGFASKSGGISYKEYCGNDPLKMKEYSDFINSDKWQIIRENLFLKRGRLCEACCSKEKILVHHINYDNFGGNEREEDLKILCISCHSKVHS